MTKGLSLAFSDFSSVISSHNPCTCYFFFLEHVPPFQYLLKFLLLTKVQPKYYPYNVSLYFRSLLCSQYLVHTFLEVLIIQVLLLFCISVSCLLHSLQNYPSLNFPKTRTVFYSPFNSRVLQIPPQMPAVKQALCNCL